ncbi:MAG: ABC transporter ATP-binding protein [Spirochaetota bacterium]|nr:ABC transporter ATP-binding protein [Spirochaetota bacterium]
MIKLDNVSKTYTRGKNQVRVLIDCNLEVVKGEFLVIMGPSGSGKSTLLNLVGGIDKADSGLINVNNQDITKMSDLKLTLFRRRNIGIIFQFFNLLPTLNVIENIALPLLISGNKYRESIASAKLFLNLVKLDNKKDHRPDELSGGEMQRVAIARALITNPSVILADEPTGNLDSKSSHEIISLLKDFSKDRNHTVLFVTHNDEIAVKGDRLINLKDGKFS